MRPLLSRILDNVLGNLAYLAIISAVGALWISLSSILPSWPWSMKIPLLIVLFLAFFGLLVWVMNQVTIFRERTKRKQTRRRTPDEVAADIRSWLINDGFQVGSFAMPETAFAISVSDLRDRASGDRNYVISMDKTEKVIYISTTLVHSPQQHAMFDAITAVPQSTLLFDLRLALLKLGIQWDGIRHPLRMMTFVSEVLWDGTITQYQFMNEHFERLRRALSIAIVTMERAVAVAGLEGPTTKSSAVDA